jgi:NAD(P)H dehydrogenase (quinone)
MMHWAAVIVPPGYSDPVLFNSGGNPYGASATADGQGLTDELKASVQVQTRRTLDIASKLKS